LKGKKLTDDEAYKLLSLADLDSSFYKRLCNKSNNSGFIELKGINYKDLIKKYIKIVSEHLKNPIKFFYYLKILLN
jgi:hypothetical protein